MPVSGDKLHGYEVELTDIYIYIYMYTDLYTGLYNKQNNTWMLGNLKFISRVEQDISLVRFDSLVRYNT